jgi:DNA-binding beta-propeller fold protein YncE
MTRHREAQMKRVLRLFVAAALLGGVPIAAQLAVPEIPFDSTADVLKWPDNIHMGEAAGVATDSRGDVFVLTRTGHPTVTIGTSRPFAHGGTRLFQFDKTGKYVREFGTDLYGFMVGQQVRVDPQDNVWAVDQMTSMVIKFDPGAQIQLLLGRKAENVRVPALPLGPPAAPPARGGGGPAALPGAGTPQDVFNRPTDVAWDAAGNIYVADGLGNSRVAKFDKNGKFVKSWGARGNTPGMFNGLSGIAIDAQGNVYVAESGNRRIQVFDGNGTVKTQYANIGTPSAICISPGAHQYLYSSNSNAPEDFDNNGEIYKMELDGKVVGKFGKVGKQVKEFGTVNGIDCRNESELYVAELANWRVQKLALHGK